MNKRHFLKLGGATVLSSVWSSDVSAAPAKDKVLKVGLVGMGDRGSGALNDCLKADANTIIWALADIDESQIEKRTKNYVETHQDRIQVEGRVFRGFDAYKKVLESGVDIVILASPPAFRPQMIELAMKAGIHVFAEKPWCVDLPGLEKVKQAVEEGGKKGVSFMTGLVWRYTPVAQQVYGKVLSGELGKVMNSASYYRLWRPNKFLGDKESFKNIYDYSVRDRWLHFRELSGDWVMEQFIHSVDKLGWAMGDELPEFCFGSGSGMQEAKSIANTNLSYNITFEYKDGRRAYLNASRHSRYQAIHDEMFCEQGRARLSSGRSFVQKGTEMIFQKDAAPLGYANEHRLLIEHIRKGEVFSDLNAAVNSHMMAMMARMAAYSGQEVFAEDVLDFDEVWFDSAKDWDNETPFQVGPALNPWNFKL